MVSTSANLCAQGFLKAAGTKIVNEKGENILLRGIGLGGWMLQEGYMLHIDGPGQQHKIRERIMALVGTEKTQEFYDAWLANHTRKIDIDSMHSWGFNSVRLPMHYNLYTLPVEKEPVAGQNTWLEKGFTLTDSLLSWCKANNMYLILDLHAAPGGQGNDLNIADRDETLPSLWASAANQQKTIALWKKMAERYGNEPWIGGYDILNEPNIGFTDTIKDSHGLSEKFNGPLKKLLMDITEAIRAVDKRHIIIIEGNGWGNNYNGMLPVWDDNMVLSFHKYWNFNNQESIRKIIYTRDDFMIPVWIGETGENSNVWYTQAVRLFENNNIGWAWWPLKKLGSNNPLEIRSNPNYDNLVKYWNGKGKKPSANDAYSGLLELAATAKLKKNIYHKDVTDALFRQPFSAEAIPYEPVTITHGTVIRATSYDLGRNGVAYYDFDTADYHVSNKPGVGNRGHTFRNDGVDIRRDTGSYDSYYISDVQAGEWVQYTINIETEGIYTLQLEVSSGNTAGAISVCLNGNVIGKTKEPDKKNKKWQILEIKDVALGKGKQVLKVQFINDGFSLKSIRFN